MAASACCGSVIWRQCSGSTTAWAPDTFTSSSRCRVASSSSSSRNNNSNKGNSIITSQLGLRSRSWVGFRKSNVQRRGRTASARRAAAGGVTRADVKYVSVEEAKEMVEKEGYTILDIRDQSQYDRSHIPSSVHIPYFIENTDSDIGTVINRQLHNNFAGLLYGLAYTKPNPEFVQQVTAKFQDKEKSKLLLVCQEGLRSGYAAERLEGVGFTNVAYINAGLNKVAPGVFPKEGEKELQDAGKAGLVTIQGPVSRVVGVILVLAYLFLQFFPDQANELFFKS